MLKYSCSGRGSVGRVLALGARGREFESLRPDTIFMKNVAVFFRNPEPMGAPLYKQEYWNVYSELTEKISKLGGMFYIVRGQESYLGSGRFKNSWRIEGGKLIETGETTVSVVFDKGRFQSDGKVKVFNDERVSQICVDKWLMYSELKKYCPKSFLVQNLKELLEKLPFLTTEKVVFKPQKGSEGKDVVIEEKTVLTEEQDLNFPGIVQEFLDTSIGIPHIVDGTHDMRVVFFDGDPIYSYVRTPPKGSLLANVAQGGTYTLIDVQDIPQSMLDICYEIDKRFSDVPDRFYSIDFGNTADGPKIIEMNSEVGLFIDAEAPVFARVKNKIAQILMEL
jgi:glutathione synthase/RimK-type ligase-like ATP-grasp enzyme